MRPKKSDLHFWNVPIFLGTYWHRKGIQMAKIAYIRVSTKEQNTGRQYELLKERGIVADKTYEEKVSGKNTDRPELKAMLAYVREGDTVYIESISRLARNTRDFLNIVELLQGKQVELVSLKESIDTATPTGKFMLSVFAALYQLERENTLQRQREGINLVLEDRKKGLDRPYGRPRAVLSETFAGNYKLWKGGKLTAVDFMKKENLPRTTFYRLVKRYEKQ